jgi:glycerol-1-phosphate dehydrogenase [NAD(P)+]
MAAIYWLYVQLENGGVRMDIGEICIEEGALARAAAYCAERGYAQVVVAVDENTLEAAGRQLTELLRSKALQAEICLLTPGAAGDVVADEATIVQLLLQVGERTDALIAVGGGTIHDITRFAAFKARIPFLSVPTAASVDGFTSAGAPILIRGRKLTYQASAPEAIFADLSVISKAPRKMAAAGFADMLGKVTSLTDWQISRIVAQEPYHAEAAERTSTALQSCIDALDSIRSGAQEGIKKLMVALVESGIVMLEVGHSRSASGAEHHLSHFWEQRMLEEGRRAALHGAKVGVATAIICELYREKLADPQRILAKHPDPRVAEAAEDIAALARALPEPERIRSLLYSVGGPAEPEDLNIAPALVQEAVANAHTLRDRYTGLKIINTFRPNTI